VRAHAATPDPDPERAANDDHYGEDESDLTGIPLEELDGRLAVPQRKEAFPEVAQASTYEYSYEEIHEADLRDSGREDEDLERHRRREQRGHQNGEYSVLSERPHGAIDSARMEPLSEERFAALPADPVQCATPCNGAEGRHGSVVQHSLPVLEREPDDQQIADFGKRQEGRVQKSDQEEAGATQRDRESLHPLDGTAHVPECRLEPALIPTSAPAVPHSLPRAARAGFAARSSSLLLGIAALTIGSAAAVHYSRAGLALAHYDARAHLVVARRILDNMLPGWQQIGAVWLPLPHVLNMLPVQVDAWYRSGASAIAISVLSTGVAVWALARFIVRTTGSVTAAAAGGALLLSNPNVLYLQSTPMTEPLLIATAFLSVMLTAEWLDHGAAAPPRAAGAALIAACMTRYEAWPIAAAIVLLAGAVLLRRGSGILATLDACVRLAAYPAIAIVLFSANSRWTSGSWFVPAGFYVAENEALGRPMLAWEQVREGLYQLSGTALVWPAYAGAAVAVLAFLRSSAPASLLLVISLAGAASLPWYAYLAGHPLRVRYAIPLVAACAALSAAGIGVLWRPLRTIAAILVVVLAVRQTPPLDRGALLIAESHRDARNMEGRRTVTEYLRRHHDGSPVMISMGSLAHYMHDLAHVGFEIRDFLHEGTGEVWPYAMLGPRGYTRWVIVEEQAEGGDALFRAAKQNARFFEGFERVAEGGGVALYRAR